MNNKFITAAIIVVLALVGFGIVSATKNKDTASNNTMSASNNMPMSDNEMKSNISDATDQSTSGANVTYKNFDVVQKVVKVKAGTTVTWTNEDSAKHDVTPTTETADFKASQLFGKGETYQVTFNTPGTYSYYCSPHPYMKGTIEVTQ